MQKKVTVFRQKKQPKENVNEFTGQYTRVSYKNRTTGTDEYGLACGTGACVVGGIAAWQGVCWVAGVAASGAGVATDAYWNWHNSNRPDWWPDDISYPDDPPEETTEMCEVDDAPEIPDSNNQPPNNACGALAAGFSKNCIESGRSRVYCTAIATAFYFACVVAN